MALPMVSVWVETPFGDESVGQPAPKTGSASRRARLGCHRSTLVRAFAAQIPAVGIQHRVDDCSSIVLGLEVPKTIGIATPDIDADWIPPFGKIKIDLRGRGSRAHVQLRHDVRTRAENSSLDAVIPALQGCAVEFIVIAGMNGIKPYLGLPVRDLA